jgi:hypothetical protein
MAGAFSMAAASKSWCASIAMTAGPGAMAIAARRRAGITTRTDRVEFDEKGRLRAAFLLLWARFQPDLGNAAKPGSASGRIFGLGSVGDNCRRAAVWAHITNTRMRCREPATMLECYRLIPGQCGPRPPRETEIQ